jgi:hypothetical protein
LVEKPKAAGVSAGNLSGYWGMRFASELTVIQESIFWT